MERSASAIWNGSLKEGEGFITSQSGVLNSMPYSFIKRFGEATTGINPEELIAAAHSSCFAMAVSAGLSKKGYEPVSINVTAVVRLEKQGDDFYIPSSDLNLIAQVPGISSGEFAEITEEAKINCPISKLLKAEITLKASLQESSQRPVSPQGP